ncbi:MAG: PEP-CTERM sorting domain-containing protein [Alphaproteobacteria bacterium]|nr:PEP-CTERM sorting domain-containing protein [Alphaproteobacteria bacterium]
MSMTRNILMAAGVAIGVSFAAAASAQPYVAPGVQNTISDDYGERIWDRDGSGTVSAGDVFIGFIGMTSSSPATYLNGTGQLPQVTGIFMNTVAGPGPGGLGLALAPTSAADAALASAAVGLNAAAQAFIAALPNLGTGGVAWLYEGADADFFPIGGKSFQTGFNEATDGSLVLVAGFRGAANEGMLALATNLDIPGDDGSVVGGALAGTFQFQLNVLLENWPDIIGFGLLPEGVELFLSGNINRCNQVHANTCGAANYQYASDATATFIPIPEPATLAMFGAGLFGLAAILRRRREQI